MSKRIQQALNGTGVQEHEMLYLNKYAPLVDTKLMLKLHEIKTETGVSIVKQVNNAIEQYIKGMNNL